MVVMRYNVQRLAHATWEYVAKTGKTVVTDTDVRAAIELILKRDDPFYTQLWNPLSAQQKKALNSKNSVRLVNKGLADKKMTDKKLATRSFSGVTKRETKPRD